MREIANQLEAEQEVGSDAKPWTERADAFPERAAEVRRSVDQGAESGRWNPRRMLQRRTVYFDGYRVAVRGLQRISGQFRLIMMDLRYAEEEDVLGASVRDTATTLTEVADIAESFGALHSTTDLDRFDDLDARIRWCERRCRETLGPVESSEVWLSAEALHIDLSRMVQECARTRDELTALRESLTQEKKIDSQRSG